MWFWLLLLLVAGFFLALWLNTRRAQQHRARFQDIVADPVFGPLVWQGYGDGDWWQAEVAFGDTPITLCIGGSDRPDPALVVQAQTITTSFWSFRETLEQFLHEQARQRPAEAEVMRSLVLTRIALFPRWADDHPDAYSGTFVVLERRATPMAAVQGGTEWRCEYREGRFTNLRLWD